MGAAAVVVVVSGSDASSSASCSWVCAHPARSAAVIAVAVSSSFIVIPFCGGGLVADRVVLVERRFEEDMSLRQEAWIIDIARQQMGGKEIAGLLLATGTRPFASLWDIG